MTSLDPLLTRSTRAWSADPDLRWRSLVQIRDALVERGVPLRAPFVAWLGEENGVRAFEACVRADLGLHAYGRRDLADEALCALLDALEEGAAMRAIASAHDPAIADELLEQALDQRLVSPWSVRESPPLVRFSEASVVASDEPPSPRPLESAIRRRLAARDVLPR